MDITISHLSGSRTGETQNFDASGPIRIGRHPNSQVRFDPHQDRLVSAEHAEILAGPHGWTIRDRDSSNGTFVGGERIKEKHLTPGDVIELGTNGPRFKVQFQSKMEAVPGTVVAGRASAGAPPPVGGTVMMAMNAEAQRATPLGSAVPASPLPRPARKSSAGKRIAIVGGVFVLLVLTAVIAAVMMRRSNVRKIREAQQAAAQQQQQETARVAALTAQTEQQSADVATKEEQYNEALEIAETSPGQVPPEVLADLRRQLEESQNSEATLLRQLQEANDRLASTRERPAEVRYKYIPAPAPSPSPSPAPADTAAVTADRPRTPASTPAVVAEVTSPAETRERPAAVEPRRGPAAPEAQTRERPAAVEPRRGPARSSEADARSRNTPSQTTAAAPAPDVTAYPGKVLKRRIAVTAIPSPIALANLPPSAARDLAASLAAALESTGKFVSEPKAATAAASVSIAVTNFQTEANVKDAKKAISTASKIGRIFGKNIPNAPVEAARTGSYEAAMSLKVELYDTSGRPLAEVNPQAQATNRKNRFIVAGVPLSQSVMSDTALGDVTRKLVAESVEGLTSALQQVEWTAPILNQRNEVATIGAGRSSGIEVGDVLETVDSYGRSGTKMRVTAIAHDTSEAEILGTVPATARKAGTRARFVGSEQPVTAPDQKRWLITNSKTGVFDGPGTSYTQLRQVGPGMRLRFDYVVGSWASVSDGGSRYWVPMTAGMLVTE